MYSKGFFITKPVGNNALSYEKRINKKLFISSLIDGKIEDITIGNEIVFEDFDFENNLISAIGLKNFYKIKWLNKDIYLFDNHNHAFYFWYLAKNNGIIGNNNLLFHIDEHSDMRKPEKLFDKENSQDLKKIFEYTNFELNVGNYIIPALENGIINEVIQIRNEDNLLNYDFKEIKKDIILNLDLDFFEPNLDYIDYNLKKKVILDIAKKAKVITIATSPFFIDQNLAIKKFKNLFFEN
ncbi:MAG: UPF0489 family protein [Candidatus Gracilibacteria bacterium]|nr:UPF0489 family protein [Candidatus Gracilibacteria bacterium]